MQTQTPAQEFAANCGALTADEIFTLARAAYEADDEARGDFYHAAGMIVAEWEEDHATRQWLAVRRYRF